MKHVLISLILLGGVIALSAGVIALSATEASAVVCARGVYRAGCVGAGGGGVVVRHPVARGGVYVHRRVYR
jgi:hypothetical protein